LGGFASDVPSPSHCFAHAGSFQVGSVHPFLQNKLRFALESDWPWHRPFVRQLSPGAQHAVCFPSAAAVALHGMYLSNVA
jgi:hypothetical protein